MGKKENLQSRLNTSTQVIDGSHKTILPGFNDSHIHVWKVGNLQSFMLDVRGAASLDELMSMLADYAKKFPEANWITARGFNEAGWKEQRLPTRADLDRVISARPVFMIRTCAHIAVANSKALELSGIDEKTITPEGGIVHHDEKGRPNGILAETALGLVANHIPPYTRQELRTMILAARSELYRYGITAVTDPAVDPVLMDTYHEMNRDGSLGIRLNAIAIALPDGGENPWPLPHLFNSDFLTINMVKFFSDGGLSGKTAALKRPYRNSEDHGVLRLTAKKFDELSRAAMQKGFGMATHAIGDAAIEFVLNQYQLLQKDFPGLIKRIEHLGLPEEAHLEKLSANQIATSMQSIFITELGKNFRNDLDQEYLDHCYPVRSVIDHGILVALSSDAPVVKDLNPFKGMQAAITRKDNEGFAIAEKEAIQIAEALKAYTANAAAISGAQDIGSLKEGMLADFIIVDQDPLSTDPELLPAIKIEKTFIDGKCVWQKDSP